MDGRLHSAISGPEEEPLSSKGLLVSEPLMFEERDYLKIIYNVAYLVTMTMCVDKRHIKIR